MLYCTVVLYIALISDATKLLKEVRYKESAKNALSS